MQIAAAMMHEDDLITGSVAVKFALCFAGPAAADRHIPIGHQRKAAIDEVAPGGDILALEVVMPEHLAFNNLHRHDACWLHLADTGGGPKVIADGVGPLEADGGNDFFVIDAFVLEAGRDFVFDMMFTGMDPRRRY